MLHLIKKFISVDVAQLIKGARDKVEAPGLKPVMDTSLSI